MLTGSVMISAVIEQMYWSGTATTLAFDGPTDEGKSTGGAWAGGSGILTGAALDAVVSCSLALGDVDDAHDFPRLRADLRLREPAAEGEGALAELDLGRARSRLLRARELGGPRKIVEASSRRGEFRIQGRRDAQLAQADGQDQAC